LLLQLVWSDLRSLGGGSGLDVRSGGLRQMPDGLGFITNVAGFNFG
jgi:hypothetical protein